MNTLDAILLGIVQGLTEFLPVSSTAHLTIVGKILGVVLSGEQWTAQVAVMQLGTLVAVLLYFRNDILSMTTAFIKENLNTNRVAVKEQSFDSRMAWLVMFGSVPIICFGLGFKKYIEGDLTKNLFIIGTMLILVALIMAVAEKMAQHNKSIKDVKLKDAMIIGFAQALALIPGTSRSGATITAGLFLGFDREAAARFSFLLSIPAILGSGLLEMIKIIPMLSENNIVSLGIATIVSGISGYAAIAFLLTYLRTRSTGAFIIYRIILGIILFIVAGIGLIQ
ncbi:undecaprenyl-diphosphatase UppP [bacterium]|nr:undecaprenyl-diphosphatase UppP [bacterium]